MFKNRTGQYTVQDSYEYAQTLARIWKFTLFTHLTFIVIFALGIAFTVKAYGDSIITGQNFSKVYSHGSIGDIVAGFIVFELITLLICALLQATLEAAREFKITWPIWLAAGFSLFVGIIFMNVGVFYARNFYYFSQHFNSDQVLYENLTKNLSGKDVDAAYNLLTWYSLGSLVFVSLVTILAFMAGVTAVLALLETRKRRVLAAKTLKEVTVREYDGLHTTREALHKIVSESLAGEIALNEDERLAIFARVETILKTNQSYVIYEGRVPVGFITRSHDYREILELWVAKARRRRHFGQVLVYYYLNLARNHLAEMPLETKILAENTAGKALLLSLGWQESPKSASEFTILTYSEPVKIFSEDSD